MSRSGPGRGPKGASAARPYQGVGAQRCLRRAPWAGYSRIVDEPKTLTELLALDDMTRAFWPLGLSGALMPSEDSLRSLRDSIDRADLVAEVPEEVRNNFERVRKTYLYGLMEYDLFTVADDDARLILEGALRVRFMTYYEGQITVIRDKSTKVISGSSFDDLYKRVQGKDVLVTRDGQHHSLSLGMGGLLAWARKERLLEGTAFRDRRQSNGQATELRSASLWLSSSGPTGRRKHPVPGSRVHQQALGSRHARRANVSWAGPPCASCCGLVCEGVHNIHERKSGPGSRPHAAGRYIRRVPCGARGGALRHPRRATLSPSSGISVDGSAVRSSVGARIMD